MGVAHDGRDGRGHRGLNLLLVPVIVVVAFRWTSYRNKVVHLILDGLSVDAIHFMLSHDLKNIL